MNGAPQFWYLPACGALVRTLIFSAFLGATTAGANPARNWTPDQAAFANYVVPQDTASARATVEHIGEMVQKAHECGIPETETTEFARAYAAEIDYEAALLERLLRYNAANRPSAWASAADFESWKAEQVQRWPTASQMEDSFKIGLARTARRWRASPDACEELRQAWPDLVKRQAAIADRNQAIARAARAPQNNPPAVDPSFDAQPSLVSATDHPQAFALYFLGALLFWGLVAVGLWRAMHSNRPR